MQHKIFARERVFERLPKVSSSLFPLGLLLRGEAPALVWSSQDQVLGRYEVCAKPPSDGRLLPGERRRRIADSRIQTPSEEPFQSIDVRRQESLCQVVYRLLGPTWTHFQLLMARYP
jgi:hypothetical protein